MNWQIKRKTLGRNGGCGGARRGIPSLQPLGYLCLLKTVKGLSSEGCPCPKCSVSWRRPKLSTNHNPEMLVAMLCKSQLLPWPFVLSRTARSHAEKLQAAWERSVKPPCQLKAKISEGWVALDLFYTPGGNFLHPVVCRMLLHMQHGFHGFATSKAMAKLWRILLWGIFHQLCPAPVYTFFFFFFFLPEKHWINPSC